MAEEPERGNLLFYVLNGLVVLTAALPRLFVKPPTAEAAALKNFGYDDQKQSADNKMSHYPYWSFYRLYYNYSRTHNMVANRVAHVVLFTGLYYFSSVFYGSFFLQSPILKNKYTDLFHPFNLLMPLTMLNPLNVLNYWKIDKFVCLVFTIWHTSLQVAAQLTLWEISKGTGSMDLEIFGFTIVAWEWSLIGNFFFLTGQVPAHIILEKRNPPGVDNKWKETFGTTATNFYSSIWNQNNEAFFLNFELLNFLFGYRSGKELDQVRYAAQEDIVLFRKANGVDCEAIEKKMKKLQ